MQGVCHHFVGGFGVAHQQIVAHGAGKERVALRHVGEINSRGRADGRVGMLVVVEARFSLVGAEQGEEHSDKRGLSRAGFAHDGGDAAGGQVAIEVGKDVSALGRITECDVAQADTDGAYLDGGRGGCFGLHGFQFHQSLSGGGSADEDGDEMGEGTDGLLYLPDELDEGDERSVGDEPLLQTADAPCKGYEVARGEADVHQHGGNGGEFCLVYHFRVQTALKGVEFLRHGGDLLQGFDNECVLQAFLDDRLHAALGGADVVSEAAHAADIEPAAKHEERQDEDNDARQRPIHNEEEGESTDELHTGGDERRQALREETYDVANVALNAVDEVAAVKLFHLAPLCVQQTAEEGHPHLVLRFDTEQGAYPS